MADEGASVGFKYYRYDPSLAAAVIFIMLFLVISVFHTWKLIRTKTWFFIAFAVGGHSEFCPPTEQSIIG